MTSKLDRFMDGCGLWTKAKNFGSTIKIEHSVFAVPFAYLSLFIVEEGWPSFWNFIWVTIVMVSARTIAMGANRLIDAQIDKENPRTANRAIPAGLLNVWETLGFVVLALGIFLGAVYQMSPLAQWLWPIAILSMVLYPYLKRFTWAAHFGIFLVYMMVPTGVWIGVTNGLEAGPVFLGLMAGFWVAGFDVIYALHDVEFDKRFGLQSIPVRFGSSNALHVSKLLHAFAIGAGIVGGILLDMGFIYYLGLISFCGLLVYEHLMVKVDDAQTIDVAFFNMNGIISVVLLVFTGIDIIVRE